ncbi:MAG TPA: response regulator transcription factor [Nitriliruptorales bacterium]
MSDDTRVVVVDDDADFRLLMRVQLDLVDGLTVVGVAGDGIEAVEVVRRERPDAVVMDLLMPKMNGFEAIQSIRESDPGIGIVAYTAVAGNYAREQTAAMGVELVLKSGDPTDLVEAIARSREAAT